MRLTFWTGIFGLLTPLAGAALLCGCMRATLHSTAEREMTLGVDLGLITATKELDVEDKGEAFISLLFEGDNARYKKNSIIECSGNVSEFGSQTKVRVNFQTKMMNNKGEVMDVRQVDDAKYYQEFFGKVDKGIFIQKEKL